MPSHSPRRSQAPPQSWYHPWTNSESRGTHFGASATIVGHAFAQNRLPFDLDQFLNSPASSTSTMAQRRSPSPGLMQAAQAAQTAQTAQGQAGNRILGMNSPVRVMMPPMPPSRAPNIQFGPGGVASGQPMQGPPSVPPTPTNLVFNDNITAMPIHGGPWPPEEVIHREEYLNGLAAIAYQAILIAPPGPPPRNWSPAIVIHPFYRELANRFQRFLTQALQQIGIVYPQPRLQELWIVLMREIFLAIELQFMSAMLGTMQNPIDLEQVRFPPYVQHYVQATLAFQQAINLPSVPPPSMWHPQMNMHPHYESVVLRFQEEFRRILHEREDFIIDDDFMTQQMLNKQTRRMFAVMREQWANVNIQMGPRPPSTPSSGRPIGPPAQGMNIPPGTLMTLPQGQVIATPHGQVLVLQPTGPRPMVSPPPGHPSAAPQPQSGRNPHMGGH
ncbi:MAG: hypothetical protein M1817_001563 [Caeruleum heppii]|nr:MAG: hypothetical protein M1817_001563 [Caeruleum heppii]